MKLSFLVSTSFFLAACVCDGALAQTATGSSDNAAPRFNDPGEHSPSRNISPPGGAPYYQPQAGSAGLFGSISQALTPAPAPANNDTGK